MRAEITKDGKLAIIPESHTEEYAIKAWIGSINKQADVEIYLEDGPEQFHLTKQEPAIATA